MLQSHRYWPGFCKVAERAELEHDPRFATAIDRARNVADCVAELDRLFAGRTLADWRERLGAQDGHWDVVQHVGELKDDRQVQANGFMKSVENGRAHVRTQVKKRQLV